ncbi:ribonuclease III [Exidia glandulosa HHB12029]|uniref:Large ribosomal subunit protein mL44 n=1 Tax=Exidia glandulosa HHB12029 TaxID=1314781 RepID=A0A165M5J0_EXIGL|nr:ribonuclease III [Exidia glandulosa HHB12029]
MRCSARRLAASAALHIPKGGFTAQLTPEIWAQLQPPPPEALSALAARIGLRNVLPDPAAIQQACTHKSILQLHARHAPDTPIPATNAVAASLGNSLMGLFAAEYLHSAYPHLPTRVMKAATTAYVGRATCASVAREMGAGPLLRWHRTSSTPTKPALLIEDALSTIPRALTAMVYTQRALPTARKFVHAFFLARTVDLRSLIKFRDPKLALSITVDKFGRERPISRLLKETGRLSNSPTFVVGIYSGADQLGEGFGSSLRMAEFRAAEDALHRLYLTRTPEEMLSLPTSTFPTGLGSVFDSIGPELKYEPGTLGESEVLFGMADRAPGVGTHQSERADSGAQY